jgi:hypothetical protein
MFRGWPGQGRAGVGGRREGAISVAPRGAASTHPPPPTRAHALDKRDSAAERERPFFLTLSLALAHGIYIYIREKTRRRDDVCMVQKGATFAPPTPPEEIEIICCILIPAASAQSPRHTHTTHRRSLSCTFIVCASLLYTGAIKVSQKALRFIKFT